MELKENKREMKDFSFPLWCLISCKERKLKSFVITIYLSIYIILP